MQGPQSINNQPEATITPQPTPFTTEIAVVATTTEPLVRLRFLMPTGVTELYLPAAGASKIAQLISERAAIAGRAILLPPGSILPVPDDPSGN